MHQLKHQVSLEIPFEQVGIKDSFWSEKLKVNSEEAIFHQWKKLEESKTIENFRIIQGEKDAFREGYFYTDSDAHKWVDAAAAILMSRKDDDLLKILSNYLDLLISVQEKDGYIFTYNQFHFPGERWINHQIEHELYTLGHLIEAAIISYKATNKESYLDLGKRAADLLVKVFSNASSKQTPGHPEVEIALIKLYRFTEEKKYLMLAEKLLEKRGRFILFGLRIFKENTSQKKRAKEVSRQKEIFLDKKETKQETLMGDLSKDGPRGLGIRFILSALSGKYFQQNKPIRKLNKPIGHSVRWGYLVTAATMLYQERGNTKLLKSLQKAWDHMVKKRMYITGGIGSLPLLESFGRNYELNNKYAYNETCAAIGSVFWNWEMLLSTGDAKYADLLEWQLYNAVLVGMSADGKSYFYRNPLEVDKTFERKEWYKTACCPSNISRTLARLSKYIYSFNECNLWIHQFVGSKVKVPLDGIKESEIKVDMQSNLPWDGRVTINLECKENLDFYLNIRVPSWTDKPEIHINGKKLNKLKLNLKEIKTASGIIPYESYYISLKEDWNSHNIIKINFPMPINIHNSHKKVRNNRNRVAFSRGPLVYCFESLDNPDLDILKEQINMKRKAVAYTSEGLTKLKLLNKENEELIARPYFSWGNKGKSSLLVWIRKYSKDVFKKIRISE